LKLTFGDDQPDLIDVINCLSIGLIVQWAVQWSDLKWMTSDTGFPRVRLIHGGSFKKKSRKLRKRSIFEALATHGKPH
jgi:hypothetical protein